MKRYFWAIMITVFAVTTVITGCADDSELNSPNSVNTEVANPQMNPQMNNSETTEAVELTEALELIPESYMVESDNYFDYQSGLECSAFSSAFILRHYGEEADGAELFKTFPQKNVDESGAPPYSITTFFNERGYEAEYKTDASIEDLKKEISKGAPVIVFIHVTEPYTSSHNTHYCCCGGWI